MPEKKQKPPTGGGKHEPPSADGAPQRSAKRHVLRHKRFLNRHRDESGITRPEHWRKGIGHLKRMPVVTAEAVRPPEAAPTVVTVSGVRWKQIGPQPLVVDKEQNFQGKGPNSGEVVDIAIDPRGATDDTIFIATNDGGIWKTEDGGVTWKPKTDLMPTLTMGAVALDPANPGIVYAGTGNHFDGGLRFNRGIGIYRSIDSGDTWVHLAESDLGGLQIVRMVVPSNGVLLVATEGGIFRSIDGGEHFGRAPNFNDGFPLLLGDITDLKLDVATRSTVYACVRGTGILVSTDGGVTFDPASNLFNNPVFPPTGSNWRIIFAQSVKPNSDTFFAAVTDSSVVPPVFKDLFKSTNRGVGWTQMPDASLRATESATAFGASGDVQADYNLILGVDPLNDQRVYIGFQQLFVSTDGANSFGTPAASLNQNHYDNHALTFSPHDQGAAATSTPVFVGNDGGLVRSTDGGANWVPINDTIASNLFLSLDIGRGSAANNQFSYGGTQDTGSPARRSGMAASEWHLGVDGDGGGIAVDPSNPLLVYGSDGDNYIFTTDGGVIWNFTNSATTGLPVGNGAAPNIPVGVDPNHGNVVYVVTGAHLFRSIDTGATFTALNNIFPAAITAFASFKDPNVLLDSNVLMVGCADGSVHRTSNASVGAASVWTPVPTGGPALPVAGLAIDPTDATVAVAVYSGHTLIDPANRTQHAFRTTDAGANWTDISGTDAGDRDQNLPDLPLHAVVIDPGVVPHPIIVASDNAVLRTADNGATWQIFGVGLPNVDCLALAMDSTSVPALLRVGTYGRSVFELERSGGQTIDFRSNLAFGSVAVGSTADLPLDVSNPGGADLIITSILPTPGTSDFDLVAPPAFPITLTPGQQLALTVRFTPTSGGNHIGAFALNCNDPSSPVVRIPLSGTAPTTLPTVTGLVPTNGPAAGGTAVQIAGTGFTGATAVLFGTNGATSFTVDSDTQISAVSPAGSGIVDVVVTAPTGTSVPSAGSRFSYAGGGLAVTSLSPSQGPETGGTAVTITGSGFAGATQVMFGGFAATGHTVDSDTQVTAISPAGNGTVDVLVATPSGTSAVTPADRFIYIVPGGGVATTTTGTGTTIGGQTGGAPDGNSEILSALADILRTGTDPEVLEAQRILLRRIALEGDVVQSRIPAPKNITEIGGYINLLADLQQPEIRLQMLASLLGVAGPTAPLGLLETGPLAAFVSIPNDRPDGPAQPQIPPKFTLRSDMIDVFQEALQIVHGVGCAVPFLTPPRALPRPLPGSRPPSEFLTILGRTLDVVPGALLGDPANDPLAIARRASDQVNAFQLVAREIDGGTKVAEASWIAFAADAASATQQPAADRRYLPLNPLFAIAGWYPVDPVELPTSIVKSGSLTRFINITGLVRDKTRLGDELALLYPTGAIMTSALTAQLSWLWNGTTFVPPR
jgi:hypothetical protein